MFLTNARVCSIHKFIGENQFHFMKCEVKRCKLQKTEIIENFRNGLKMDLICASMVLLFYIVIDISYDDFALK